MLEEKRVFLLNEEQKILVFLSYGQINDVPKIIIPTIDMFFLNMLSIEEMEYITEIKRKNFQQKVMRKLYIMLMYLSKMKKCKIT